MRQRRAAAMSSARAAREREQRRGKGSRESRERGERQGGYGRIQTRRGASVASRRWPGRRRRSPPSCFGARGGRRQEKGGLGRAGPVLLGHEVGFTGKSPGMCSVLYFCSVFFYLIFCHCFEFKIIQTMPKTPLNIIFLLDGLFQKLIKYFRGI